MEMRRQEKEARFNNKIHKVTTMKNDDAEALRVIGKLKHETTMQKKRLQDEIAKLQTKRISL